MDLQQISAEAAPDHLEILGVATPTTDENAGAAVVLLGPREPGFWAHFTSSPEYTDKKPHPLDRWSTRVITALADRLGAHPRFPFGGPPYQPFIPWALRSGRAWQSPAGPLVHDTAGMMVSYRGALAFSQPIAAPSSGPNPCKTCADKPCLSACPVNALSAETGYDISACHSFLDSGPDCITQGCRARRACPVSQTYSRRPEQSAFHMRSFHPVSST